MEEFLTSLSGLFNNTSGMGAGAAGGQISAGPGQGPSSGVGIAGLSAPQKPWFTPEQLRVMQAQMAAEMFQPRQEEEVPAPQPIEQPQGQPQQSTNDALADILARYGFSDDTNRQPAARAWGSIDGGTWNGGGWNG